MANWNTILDEINTTGSTYDTIRRKYIKQLSNKTGRNTICYYSGWLQKNNAPELGINDNDKNGLMNAVDPLDHKKGLDLILHTPGGDIAATESIGEYLREIFGYDIRIFIPQLAMSGGTLLSLLGKEILMGPQSSLGPIDPQISNLPAQGILAEYEHAIKEMKEKPNSAYIWQQVFSKCPPSFLTECKRADAWSKEIAGQWLSEGMFKYIRKNKEKKIAEIVEALSNHEETYSHARHLSPKKCKSVGLKINTDEYNTLKDPINSVHHALMLTLDATPATKIIQNNLENTYIQNMIVRRVKA
jgi:ATP-dependent protease ClpP protease subunit